MRKGKRIVRHSTAELRKKIARGEDRTDLRRVEAMSEEDITRAIKSDPAWKGLLEGNYLVRAIATPGKEQVTLRLDKDVLDFFRKNGRRYQTRINNALRAVMELITHAN